MGRKVIITAAICGAEVTKANNPAVPYTIAEIQAEAKRAYDAGAAVIHLHVRWDDGTPTQDAGRFQEAIEAIYEVCPEAILIPSTGGAMGMTAQERGAPIDLRPEMATLDCGTMNFGGDIFVNTEEIIRAFGTRMLDCGVKPELECFDRGMVETALRLSGEGWLPAPLQFNFVLGVRGGMSATPENLMNLVSAIPPNSTWCVSGVGKRQFDMVAAAVLLGGNVRVGLEDNVYLSKGVPARSNGELVEKAVRIVRALDREVATPAEARCMLGLSLRRPV